MRIVGRDAELKRVREFLQGAASGTRALYLHGEAGIGKSTIWQHALAEAADNGFRVVASRPTEAEARLPFAGLNDLLGPLLDEVQPELPPPQRSALDVALMRAAADGSRPEPLAISLAVLAVLRAAAERGPLAIGIDDVPWLDESSTSVLDFALRRLENEPIAIIVAERRQGPAVDPPPLVTALSSHRITDVGVAPMSKVEIDRLLAATLGLDLPPSALALLHRTSGGNPFYAVEIGRAMERRGATVVDWRVPLPGTLAGLLRDRLAALSPAATSVVNTASALSQPTIDVLHQAAGHATAEGLAAAVAAGVLSVEGGLVRFSHPLLAAEAYGRLPDAERRDLHRRLAAIVSEREEHARHLALAATGPDETVARELEAAAEHASERGAADAAADLAERAILLTPDDDAARRGRQQSAARYRLFAGDVGRARELLEAALEGAPDDHWRAGALMDLGSVRQYQDDWQAAGELFSQALNLAGDDLRLTIEIKLKLAGVSHITGRDREAGALHVTDAMRLADELGDPRLLVRTIGPYATWQWVMTGTYPPELERRAADLEPWTAQLRSLDHPSFDFSNVKRANGDARAFRELHEGLLERAQRIGDYTSITFLMANLATLDVREGRTAVGLDRLDQAERLARTTRQGTALAHVLVCRAIVLGRLGRADEAWRIGRAVFEQIDEIGFMQGLVHVAVELALLELSRRNPEGALAALTVRRSVDPDGPGDIDFGAPVAAEALIGIGRLDEARGVLDATDADPRSARIGTLDADLRRARALLLAAAGDLDGATELIESVRAMNVAHHDRWEEARTQLVAGEIHRRARRRAKARAALADALATFEELGAVLWADQVREELGRIGGVRDDARALTPTQQQVAELAMEGLTNRQIADRLFMSIHTVEAHLSAIYRTLGIGSRSELARTLGIEPAEVRDSRPANKLKA